MRVIIWSLLLLNYISTGSSNCVFPWVQLADDSPCYTYSPEILTFYQADEFCKQNGGLLAEPRGVDETNILIDILPLESRQYWIGLTDLAIEGNFEWMSDATL